MTCALLSVSVAHYLSAKAGCFDPYSEESDDSIMNWWRRFRVKATLLMRLRGDRGQRSTLRSLHYYFVA